MSTPMSPDEAATAGEGVPATSAHDNDAVVPVAPIVSPHEAEGILQLVQNDSEAEAALRASYTGRFEIADALWWRVHPSTESPSGAADPGLARAALQAEAFSRTGSAAAEAQLAALERQLADDAALLDRGIQDARPALTAASTRADRRAARERREAEHAAGAAGRGDDRNRARGFDADRPGGGPDRSDRYGDDGDDDDGYGDDGDDDDGYGDPAAARATSTAARWRRRSQIWMSAAIVCAVLLLAGIGLVVVQRIAPEATPGFALVPTAAGSSIPTPSQTLQGATRGLTIFSDPSLAPSIPPANIDPYYQPDSLRLLGVANSFLTVYAVENRINQPCLLAVYTDGTQSATCVTTEEFTSMGIELRITSLQPSNGTAVAGRAVSQDVVFWNPDGSYGVSSSARTPPAG